MGTIDDQRQRLLMFYQKVRSYSFSRLAPCTLLSICFDSHDPPSPCFDTISVQAVQLGKCPPAKADPTKVAASFQKYQAKNQISQLFNTLISKVGKRPLHISCYLRD